MKKKVKIGILGATGYTGVELCRIIARHPYTTISFLTSETYSDKRIHEVFPALRGICEHRLVPLEDGVERRADLVFSCLPHGSSAEKCLRFLERKIRIVDLSADFRLESVGVYRKWYSKEHPDPETLKSAVFGMPEFNHSRIKKSRLVANPGCYTISILLPLIPLLRAKAIEISDIVADSKSGVTGASRALKLTSLFPEANENLSAYSIGRTHQHLAEIDQELSREAGKDVRIIFSPHLVPLNRGILSTIYVYLKKNSFANKIEEIYHSAFKSAPFVRVAGQATPQIRSVAHTNFCDIGWTSIPGTNRIIIVSAIDNLLKGASGHAVQNMNIMFGFDEKAGLI